jgi:membrane protein required for colicin V production
MELGFTWFDFVALAVLGLSGVMAFARGLIREVFSIIAFIGGALAAIFFSDLLRPFIESSTDLSGALASVAAGLLIFLVVFVLITVVTSAVAKTAHQSTEIGSFDRAAGLAFGVLRGVLVVAIFVLLIRRTQDEVATAPGQPTPQQQDLEHCRAAYDPFVGAVRCARTYPIYEGVAKGLEVVVPRARERARDYIEGQKGESAPIPPAEPQSQPAQQQPATP